MHFKNTAESYGSIAKWFHWVTAGLFLASYCAIYYRHWFAQSELENWTAIQLHFSIGISIGVIVILRLFWRGLNQQPSPEPGSRFQQVVARLSHNALYGIMIIMPISGYLSIANYLSSGGGSITFFLLFEITSFKEVQLFSFIGLTLEQLEDPADLVHSILGGWIVWLLIIGHGLAAMHHHFIKKDKTLIKMSFCKP